MVDMWELARHVEDNPDDYPERWRLAKKLYNGWEYRIALEHLQVLRNHWEPRVNVCRYLAATYYKLGRHEDAIRELETGIEEWPDETGLREQLGRVLEVAGKRKEASGVWDEIARKSPDHPLAKKTAERLRREDVESYEASKGKLRESDGSIDLRAGTDCAVCGAENSSDFDRCWQCHAPLPSEGGAQPKLAQPQAPPVDYSLSPDQVLDIVRKAGMVLAAAAAAATILMWVGAGPEKTIRSFADLYANRLHITRTLTGLVWLILSPLVLGQLAGAFGLRRALPEGMPAWTGLALGALGYLATWLPVDLLLPGQIGMVAASILAVLFLWRIPVGPALAIAALHGTAMLLLGTAALIGAEFAQTQAVFQPFRDVPKLTELARDQFAAGSHQALPGEAVPVELRVRWESTGSPWLDARAQGIEILLENKSPSTPVKFELAEGTTTRIFVQSATQQQRFFQDAQVGQDYFIRVEGPEGAPVSIAYAGVLPIRVLSGP